MSLDGGPGWREATENPRYPNRSDRGHLVRREYPNWSRATVAKRANADTFHFTNHTPQAAIFNQSTEHWQGIENYVIRNAEDGDKEVSVFVGPIFNTRGPQWKDVRL